MKNPIGTDMEKTKILYVITSLGLGGAERLLLTYLKKLDPKKYNLKVCCLREKPNDLLPEISKLVEVFNINIKNKFNPLVLLHLIKVIRRTKPDIIHTHLFQARVYTTLAKLFCNHSVLITQKHNKVNPRKHHIFIILESISLLFNKKVIAISQSVKNSLMKYELIPSKKIFVLPNCIDYLNFYKKKDFSAISNKNQIIIGCVGRLERQKGIKYLLLAMKTVLARYPDAKVEIVGDGSLSKELKELSKKLNISNSVIFFGKFADVIPFYNRMDVFVLPSIYEGFGIVLLEAMAAGIPVVATNVDGIKEVIINMNCGILVPPKNPEALADAILKIIEDPHLSKHLVEEGLQRAKLFDVKEHIMKLDNLYSNLLGVESSK